MSKLNVKITNIESLKKLLRERIMFSDFPKIEKRVRDNLRPVIEDLIITELLNNDIYKGIKGDFAGDKQKDVQAHMGLYDFYGEDAANQIEKAFRESIKVDRNNKGIGFTVVANKLEENVLNIPSASYESNGYIIPWIDWLVNGGASVAASIVFFQREMDNSRSGRALMIEDDIGWSMDSFVFGQGPNFLEQILQSETLKSTLIKLVVKEFKEEVKRYYG